MAAHMMSMVRTPLVDEQLHDADKQAVGFTLDQCMLDGLGDHICEQYRLCAESQQQYDQTYQALRSQERVVGERKAIEHKVADVQRLIKASIETEQDAVNIQGALEEEYVQAKKTVEIESPPKPIFPKKVIKGRPIMPENKIREVLAVVWQARSTIKKYLQVNLMQGKCLPA